MKIETSRLPAMKERRSRIDYDRLVALGRELLEALGEDPEREGLLDTPRRWASWWEEFIEHDPGNTETTFEAVSPGQLITISNMRVYSMCEHHLLPFWCDVSVGYISYEKVLGLSKFGRIAQDVAHKLQLQERLTNEIADEISRVVESPDVIVMATGEHMCMQMRGVKMQSKVSSLAARGVFSDNYERRAEFQRMIKLSD